MWTLYYTSRITLFAKTFQLLCMLHNTQTQSRCFCTLHLVVDIFVFARSPLHTINRPDQLETAWLGLVFRPPCKLNAFLFLFCIYSEATREIATFSFLWPYGCVHVERTCHLYLDSLLCIERRFPTSFISFRLVLSGQRSNHFDDLR